MSLAGCQGAATKTDAAAGSSTSAAALLTPGPWFGELAIQGQRLPFLFEVKTEAGQPVVYLINKGLNGEERLRCPEISAAGDSAIIKLHAFDAALVVRTDGTEGDKGPNKLKGTWVKYDAKTPYRVPFTALQTGIDDLFVSEGTKVTTLYKGLLQGETFSTVFTDETGKKYPAVAVIKQQKAPQDDNMVGTFLTTTGDYRYLSGNSVNRQGKEHIMLSTFDGNHAFLFDAQPDKKQGMSLLKGDFYSGKTGHETWTAILDPKAKLPDADTLTYLKKGESRLSFKFPSTVLGASISPTDPKYRGKVVVLQVLGSWCPNCMDETNFLAPWYEKNKQRGVEIIGLGYERMPEYDKAAARLRGMKTRFNIGYDVAVAGVSNKDSVAKSLPQLAKFLAFPTTIFIDKKGAVRKIHTGFSGPGTGKYYAEETAAFNQEIDKLLKE
ncbi:hypothetical protein BEN49_01415 [Hymenobacter coccineus]|uniref:Thioredoxin domain-containing protein n=1 Tax=Hymenobacter coccineus TaxID=1908235 RepID=A0A1G1TDS4_9BACT|nr:hypothetical protein BEN49_01415 [Hymenobacter coccineus]